MTNEFTTKLNKIEKMNNTDINLIETKISIPLWYYENWLIDLEKTNKKANKIGLGEDSIKHEVLETKKVWVDYLKKEIDHVLISLIYPELKIPGYRLVGILDYSTGNKLIKYANEEVVLNDKFDKAECEVCKTSHNRKKTFVFIDNETKRVFQVGSNCVEKFTGLKIPDYTNLFDNKEGISEDDFFGNYFGGTMNILNTEDVIKASIFFTDKYGYQNTKSNDYPTVNRVFAYIDNEYKAIKEINEVFNFKTVEVEEKYNQLKLFIEKLNPKNDYEYNLKTLFNTQVIKRNFAGYLVSLYNFYLNAIKIEGKLSDINYNKGDKFKDLKIKLTSKKSFMSAYGLTFVYNFDNLFTWFSSKNENMNVNQEYTLSGTIKEIKDNQILVTRCKVA